MRWCGKSFNCRIRELAITFEPFHIYDWGGNAHISNRLRNEPLFGGSGYNARKSHMVQSKRQSAPAGGCQKSAPRRRAAMPPDIRQDIIGRLRG